MDGLSANNWLDVTKDNNLVSDADFRSALGKLRGIARQATATDIGKALNHAIVANGGQIPSSPQDLAQYLPSGTDPAILIQLQMNPSGMIPGLKSQKQFVLVDTPVDIWDDTMFYNTEGNWGSRSIGQGEQSAVTNAIAQFTQATGTAPTEASQLVEYTGISSLNPTDLSVIFQALTTRPP